jgi:hypothetical protein
MKRFEEVNDTLDRILRHESDRRPRLTKAQYATILDALCCLGDIYETASEMKHSEAVSYLMAAIPNLTKAEAKERMR